MVAIYQAGELRAILQDLVEDRRVTLEQAIEQKRQKFPDEGEDSIKLRALMLRDRDLADTLIDVIPQLIALNNERLVQVLSGQT